MSGGLGRGPSLAELMLPGSGFRVSLLLGLKSPALFLCLHSRSADKAACQLCSSSNVLDVADTSLCKLDVIERGIPIEPI